MSPESEAFTVLSHRDEALAPLAWWDGANGLRICLMIGETTGEADCLTYLKHRR